MFKNITLRFSWFVGCVFITGNIFAQQLLYKNPSLPIEQRVEDLLQRMTVEEKFWQCFMVPGEVGPDVTKGLEHGIFGFQVNTGSKGNSAAAQLLQYKPTDDALALAKKINITQRYFVEHSRLGIPIIAFDEALHGLLRAGATAFPQSIGLAAMWDTAMMKRVANVIAIETKARGIRQILSPVINLATDVRWGRTEETYGEDPFLTSAMGVAFMKTFEDMGIITTPKHYLANVGDGGRDSYPIDYSKHFLRETHLVPFKAAFQKAGARSVMTSYNSIGGDPATANKWLLTDLLKDEWGFKGFVISDAGATGGSLVLHKTAKNYPESAEQSINAGLDVIFQTAIDHHTLFDPPFLDGSIDRERLDDAVRRVLRAKFELGLFENPYVDESAIEKLIDVQQHKAIAEEAAAKSFVLLKNNGVLPLGNSIKNISLIGDDATLGRLGGYSGPGNGTVTILQGLQKQIPKSTNLHFARGYSRSAAAYQVIPSKNLTHINDGKVQEGLLGSYYATSHISGKPSLVRSDKQVDFHWTLFSPDESLRPDDYAVEWTGKLLSPGTGYYKIGMEGNDGYRLYINGVLLLDRWSKQSYHTDLKEYVFNDGEQYDIKVQFKETAGNATIKLVWSAGIVDNESQWINEAVAKAKQSDVVIMVGGIHEGEFQDRASLALDGAQEKLIEALAATGKPVVVLMVGGSAITLNSWQDKVAAIVSIWYPGESGGNAVASMLLGKVNPGGKLPITFPVSEAQLPLSYWHKPTGRGDDYHNLSGLPLYPFGYGLSYTTFEYSNISINKPLVAQGEKAIVKFKLSNTGKYNGDEVVQLYIRDELTSISQPVMTLKGFQRVSLKAGESRYLEFVITPEMLQMLNAQDKWVVEPGKFRIMIGASSRELPLKADLEVR